MLVYMEKSMTLLEFIDKHPTLTAAYGILIYSAIYSLIELFRGNRK